MKHNTTIKLNNTDWASVLLRIFLWVYIGLCILIAGLNFGYAEQASPRTGALITWIWHVYENWVKTVFIVICGLLTLMIVRGPRNKKQQRVRLRRNNIIGLTCSALVVHIVVPLLLDNPDIYFFAMPLPWTTMPLQASVSSSEFFQRHVSIWGTAGMSWALTFFWVYSTVAFAGTLVMGRRWFCSTLCLFNGFAAEVFGPVMPLVGTKQGRGTKGKGSHQGAFTFFSKFRWIYFGIALLLTGYWASISLNLVHPGGVTSGNVFSLGTMNAIASVETWKYLGLELLMAMFFWVAFIGRGYCLYCPVGTFFGLISRLVGQKIVTDETRCISCGRCSRACPVKIDVQRYAEKGVPVRVMNCVGCGHCVDVCPTETLRYTTRILELFHTSRRKKTNQLF